MSLVIVTVYKKNLIFVRPQPDSNKAHENLSRQKKTFTPIHATLP